MKNFIFAVVFALCAMSANAQVAQPANGHFTCEVPGAPTTDNPSACHADFAVNMTINNELGCEAIESDRYWIIDPFHSGDKMLISVWTIEQMAPGVTCTGPQSGVTTFGYTPDSVVCPLTSVEQDSPYDGSIRCYCPYQNVPYYGPVPGKWDGYPTPSCVPNLVYINPFFQPNAPQ